MKEYNSVDLVKVCMAFVVVAIHTHPQDACSIIWVKELLTSIYNLAVPFFFVASGFLVWKSISDASKEKRLLRLKRWINKTARLYVLWTLIYIPFTIYGFYKDDVELPKSLIVFIRNFLFVGENYLSYPLWYLLGALVAGSVIYLMVKWNFKVWQMYIVGIFLALVGFCLDEGIIFSGIYEYLFKTTRNGLFQGLPYILIGVLIAYEGGITSKKILCALLVVGFSLCLLGVELFKFLVIYSFFSLVIQTDMKGNNDSFFENLRLISTVVYFVHMIWVGFIVIFFPNIFSSISLFVVVAVLSLATALVVIKNQSVNAIKLLFK